MSNTTYHPTEEHKVRIREGIKKYWSNNPNRRREAKCLFCGGVFMTKVSDKKKGKGKYCSIKCYGNTLKRKMRGRGNHFYGKHHSNETKRKLSLIQNGTGDTKDGGYSSIHKIIRYRKGKPKTCSNCRKTGIRIEWANIDHKYRVNLNQWIPLCCSCHAKHDKENGLRKKGKNYGK